LKKVKASNMKKVKDEEYAKEIPHMVCISGLLASLTYLTITNLPSLASWVSLITFSYLLITTLKDMRDE